MNSIPPDRAGLILMMAMDAAFASRSRHDVSRDAREFWDFTDKEHQTTWLKSIEAALAALEAAGLRVVQVDAMFDQLWVTLRQRIKGVDSLGLIDLREVYTDVFASSPYAPPRAEGRG